MNLSNPAAAAPSLTPNVLRAAEGDSEAFTQLVEATSSTVCSIAFSIVRNRPASEDIAQEVYLSVWRGLKTLRNPRSFLSWLRQLTRNRSHSWLRRQYARRAHQRVGDEVLDAVADPGQTPDASLEDRENLRLVAAALEAIPESSREVLVLYYREGRSTEQVARLLELSESAVRKRLQRARKGIRVEVAERVARGIEKTAPTVALMGAMVTAAMVTTAPANAAILSMAATKSSVGALKLGWLAASAGVFLGATGGIAGIIFGLRSEFTAALDDAEVRQLQRFRTVGVVAVLLACLGFVGSARIGHWLPPTAVYLAFLTTLGFMYLIWLPRIAARRRDYQRQTDPQGSRKHRLRGRRTLAGFILGAISGGTGLFLGLWFSGLLPWR